MHSTRTHPVPRVDTVSLKPDIRGIKLKNPPFFLRIPPLLRADLFQGGFLSLFARRRRKILGFGRSESIETPLNLIILEVQIALKMKENDARE